jgi:hypothetical protein
VAEAQDEPIDDLWFAVGTRDYFSLPDGAEIPEGDLVIRAIRGNRERSVDRGAIARFAIPREEATRLLQADAARALSGAREAITRLLELSIRIPGMDDESARKLRDALKDPPIAETVRNLGERIDNLLHSPEVDAAIERIGRGLKDVAKRIRVQRDGPGDGSEPTDD